MITCGKLKKLLAQVPDDAEVTAYEGEDCGISIQHIGKDWWIQATDNHEEDNYNQGFNCTCDFIKCQRVQVENCPVH